MRLGRAHIAFARITCAQTAGGANVPLASVLHRCAMGALRVRTTSSLGAAYRTQILQLYGMLVYHAGARLSRCSACRRAQDARTRTTSSHRQKCSSLASMVALASAGQHWPGCFWLTRAVLMPPT
jgi:hypothetical protein